MQCGQGSLNAKMATLARSFSAGGSKRAQGFHFVFNHLCCVSNLCIFLSPCSPVVCHRFVCCFLTTEHLHKHTINTHTLTTHTELYQIPNKFDDFCWHIYLSIYRSGCVLSLSSSHSSFFLSITFLLFSMFYLPVFSHVHTPPMCNHDLILSVCHFFSFVSLTTSSSSSSLHPCTPCVFPQSSTPSSECPILSIPFIGMVVIMGLIWCCWKELLS